jgi:hypothetical protein
MQSFVFVLVVFFAKGCSGSWGSKEGVRGDLHDFDYYSDEKSSESKQQEAGTTDISQLPAHHVTLVAVGKIFTGFMDEWLSYHLLIGVSHFVVGLNECDDALTVAKAKLWNPILWQGQSPMTTSASASKLYATRRCSMRSMTV